MNTEHPGTEMNATENPVNEKHLQTEDAINKEVLFEQIKKLYLALKELNQRLQNCLQETGLKSH